MTTVRWILFCGALILVGCSERTIDVEVPATHPANADAAAAPATAPSTTLALPASGPAAGDQQKPVPPAPGGGTGDGGHQHDAHPTEAAPAAQAPATSPAPGTPPVTGDLYWCKHHHEVVQVGPGKCSTCGMTLVPKPADGGAK